MKIAGVFALQLIQMKKVMCAMPLSDYKLSIPTVSLKDWQQAVETASGHIREVLVAQTSGVRTLQTVKEDRASTERIGWLNLWAKTFAALETAAAGITHRSRLGLLMCQRNSFELMLQVHTIMDPLQNPQNKSSETKMKEAQEYAMRSCIDRLRAYTAWCLWHDKAYYNEMLNPKSIRDVWNFEFFDALKKESNPAPQVEQFLKEFDNQLDERNIQKMTRNVRSSYTQKVRQIDRWLADPRLRKWSDTIEQVSRENIVGVPFFMLFDRADASVPKRLLKEGMRFTYPDYILSSIASHGSSMEEFIQIEPATHTISPILTGDEEQIDLVAPEVIFRCQHIFTILDTINVEMTQNPQIRS